MATSPTPSIQFAFDGPGALDAGDDGLTLLWDNALGKFVPGSAGISDHGALTGLADDDHAGYALLAGRAGGQTLNLGLNSADAGTINASAHATKGALTLGASQVIVPAGTAALPAVAFTGDTDNGMYYIGANNWALGRNGNPMIEFGPGGVDLSKFHKAAQFVEAICCADGSAGIPGITFQNDQDTGIFRTGTDSIAIASGGVAWWTFGSAVATLMRQTIMVTNSAAITPSVVRGAASQSANLQEWQSSAGTVLVAITAAGTLSTLTTINGAGSLALQASSQGFLTGTSSLVSITKPLALSSTYMQAASSGAVTLPVRGSSGGAVNIVDLMTSAGTILSGVDASGRFLAPLGGLATCGYAFLADPNTGLFSTGADDISVVAGGVDRIRANATGIGFFAATPVAKQAFIADPSGGATVDAEARTAIAAVITALENYGLLATS